MSRLLCLNSRPVTILILGELERSFLAAWNGGPSARVGVVVRPLLSEDCMRAQEILKTLSTSATDMPTFIFFSVRISYDSAF